MTSKALFQAIALAATLATAAPAFAQTGGAPAQGGHAMPGMDMGAMMKQCAQMRQQMQAGTPMAPNMQSMMRQCDAMNQQMAAPGDATGAPRPRTR